MGIEAKIATAKKTNWVTEGISKSEIKTTIILAKISAKIERCRLDMGMTQKEFAEYMGVTQGMISKWESRDYNFTLKTLDEVCQKLNLTLEININKSGNTKDSNVISLYKERLNRMDNKGELVSLLDMREE